jgi:hypothetical protein
MTASGSVTASTATAPRRCAGWRVGLFAGGLLAGLGMGVSVRAAAPGGGQDPARPQARPPYLLGVTNEGRTEISLDAIEARLSDIAADLSQRLKVEVIVGPTLRTSMISMQFIQLPLESAMILLAPRVYLDYEVRRGAQATLRAIYFLGSDDSLSAADRGPSQGVMIEGHTEDTEKQPADDPLRLEYDRGRLTIVSKQQPLAVVVMAVAAQLSISSDIRYEAAETVDTVIRDVPAEEAMLSLSPNIRLDVRVDVSRGEREIRRIVVAPPGMR